MRGLNAKKTGLQQEARKMSGTTAGKRAKKAGLQQEARRAKTAIYPAPSGLGGTREAFSIITTKSKMAAFWIASTKGTHRIMDNPQNSIDYLAEYDEYGLLRTYHLECISE